MKETGIGFLFLMLVIAVVAANGWLMMLAIGVIHADVLPAVRPAGFSTGLVLGLLLTTIFASASSSSK